MKSMINVEKLTVKKRGTTICSIKSLDVQPCQRIAILGPNGSGKSTFLRVLAGLEQEFHGKCTVNSPQIERVYVHQNPFLFRGSVVSNVTYGLRARKRTESSALDTAGSILRKLGIANLSNRDVCNLSGGEKRRVAIARAVILRPQLLLFDEPFAEIDDDGVSKIVGLLEELTESTVLIASPTPISDRIDAREFHLLNCVERNPSMD